jgi:chromosome segregation ATPase
MRYLTLITLSAALSVSGIMSPESPAESLRGDDVQTNAQEKAANLRSQLSEVEARQSDLQTRLQKLEEDMKSENIEHSLAGVGSTRPEDLREQKRRQLEIERNGVRAQLDLLAVSHSRLQTAIAQADAEAYRQSAAPMTATTPAPIRGTTQGPSTNPGNEATTPERRRRVRKKKTMKSKRAHHTQNSGRLEKRTCPPSGGTSALSKREA